MEWRQFIVDIYERISQVLETALEGLTQDDLNQQPNPDSNSIGWLCLASDTGSRPSYWRSHRGRTALD